MSGAETKSAAKAFLNIGERRALTGGEIAFAREVFGDEIAWAKIRLLQAPPLGFSAMAPLRHTILYSQWRARRDFTQAPLGEQGWLVHELAHVWQAGRGIVLPAAKLMALGRGAYAYAPRARARLKMYNIEAQAEIVRHLFLARAGAPAAGAPELAWLEEVWMRRW